ncbi:hypothetical protein BVX97_06130 [bacterium E08(2017)]|nr:hypothetical protein BVX97_06130 [bacterium E08(2017)]
MTDQPTQEQIGQIAAALADGNKIKAIKIYRDGTGKDLKAAKEFIESLIPKLQEQDPEKYAKLNAQTAGCASVILLCIGLPASIAWVIHSLA